MNFGGRSSATMEPTKTYWGRRDLKGRGPRQSQQQAACTSCKVGKARGMVPGPSAGTAGRSLGPAASGASPRRATPLAEAQTPTRQSMSQHFLLNFLFLRERTIFQVFYKENFYALDSFLQHCKELCSTLC